MLSWLIGCNYDRGGFISQGKKKKKDLCLLWVLWYLQNEPKDS
jgi:hypothetical protein